MRIHNTGRVSLVRVDPTRGGHPGEGVPASRRAEDGHRSFTGSAGGGGITCPPCGMSQDLKLVGFFRGRSPPSGEPNCYRGALMVSPWCLVPPQARDSVSSGPLLGQHPPGPKTPRTLGAGGAHEVVILPVRYPPGVQAPGLRYVDPPESGPLPPIAPPLSLPCQSRCVFGASHFRGGSQRMIFWGGGGDTPSVRCQGPVCPRFRAAGPVNPLLMVRDNVSRGPEGADFLRAPLYASYLRSCCPSQRISVRAPG
ncbi:hypothetical protein NDU88_005519 [Pleurodeles waltl]|uniref:Uncharacterized protein n=1 Tax=Pleurodeles waltl TaxID=8319 RepID=A0AAV7N0T1_PLEWA|nr:hypothetical protein NDU88_005519 [Pleurodeles waltl]